jgi:hypothetical protein
VLPEPVRAAIAGREDDELAVDRIPEDDSVPGIPKRNGVEEAFRVGIRKLESPMCARIGGLVNSRFLARAAREQVGSACIRGMDAAKI